MKRMEPGMKRAGNLIERIADADNLRLAFWKASQGKRAKAEVLRFQSDLDARLRVLREELLAGSVRWGPYRTFKVYDPKERMICAAPFRDRVAQHAIINVVEPHFESLPDPRQLRLPKRQGLGCGHRSGSLFLPAGRLVLEDGRAEDSSTASITEC